MSEDERPLSPKQVAEHLGISYKTVWRFLNSGRLKSRKVGAQHRIYPEDLQEFLKHEQERRTNTGDR